MVRFGKRKVLVRDIQHINFAFGTAFGAFVGIMLATRELTESEVVIGLGLVVLIAQWLIFFEDVVETIFEGGIKRHAWLITLFLVMTLGIQIYSAEIPVGLLIGSRILQFWGGMLLFYLFMHRIFNRREQ